MKAELKSIHSPDAPEFPRWQPADPRHFQFLVEASIGLTGQEGSDIFGILVCSASSVGDADGPVWGRHRLMIPLYDADLIITTIRRLCDSIEAEDWPTMAARLAQFGDWEFDGYR